MFMPHDTACLQFNVVVAAVGTVINVVVAAVGTVINVVVAAVGIVINVVVDDNVGISLPFLYL